MAVAVITDIHANRPALEAALERIEELGIEQIYCGGDLVGYGPHPNEVCTLIDERGVPTIYGNYDFAIARDLDDCGCAYITALFGGPLTDASMNPARTLGPALASGQWTDAWIYLIGPITGAIAGGLAYQYLRQPASDASPATALTDEPPPRIDERAA